MSSLSALYIVWVLGAVAQGATVVTPAAGPTIFFSKGQPLDELRGASILAPKGEVVDLSLTMSAATLQGPENATNTYMLSFTNPMYRDDSTAEFNIFAPTIRIPAGRTMTIKLTNNLTYPTPTLENNSPNAVFKSPFITNMHTHGLHASPGVFKQEKNGPYTGADNIFYELNPRNSTESEANFINYTVNVPNSHSPGMFYYHPHFHGSSGLQTVTSNGILIVEDDPEWLPKENGCTPVMDTMASAKDVMLHLSILNFLPPILGFPGANAGLDDTSIPVWGQNSDPRNPLCCGNSSTANTVQGPLSASGSSIKNDTLLLNGGYQPVMTMEAGVYQRWRVLHTGYKNWVDIQILDASTKTPTEDCELSLIAKDGIYLKTIPRTVDHIYLASGNRAELFVRCSKPGVEYILASGVAPSPFCGANFTSTNLINQEIATIRVVEPISGASSAALTPNACTPLRSDYAGDLSDESLAAFNATNKLFKQDVSFTFGNQTYGCLVNNKNFSYPDPDPLKMPLGKIVEWGSFLYASEHPLHTHNVPYQLQKLDTEYLQPGCSFTSWFEAGDWQDTLLLPMTAASDTAGDSNLLRMQPGPFTGYAVMHCHFLHHEDEGCMKVMEFSCDGATGEQPRVCSSYIVPVPGTYSLKKKSENGVSPSPAPPSSAISATAATSFTASLIILINSVLM